MTPQTETTTGPSDLDEKRLRALRVPFPAEVVGTLPKGPKTERSRWTLCPDCGANMGPHVHLSYIGHAAVTDRLLDTDPHWNWEPAALSPEGLPLYRETDSQVELWIRLTVAGVTRLGVGVVDKGRPDGAKELISDALKNAAMRFGVALYLWSKDELESLIGNETVAKSRVRKPPRSSTPVRARAPIAPVEPLIGSAIDSRTRNFVVAYYAHRDKPIYDEEPMMAEVNALLDLPEPVPRLSLLTVEQGVKLCGLLGTG